MLVKYTVEAAIKGLTKALELRDIKVVITPSVVRAAALPDIDVHQVLQLKISAMDTCRGVSGMAIRIVSKETLKVLRSSILIMTDGKHDPTLQERAYAALLHEVGHIFPIHTNDEVLAWERGWEMAEVITPAMWNERVVSLDTYRIPNGGRKNESKVGKMDPQQRSSDCPLGVAA